MTCVGRRYHCATQANGTTSTCFCPDETGLLLAQAVCRYHIMDDSTIANILSASPIPSRARELNSKVP
eukprot:479021-Amphidinium_carterae.1